MDIQSIISQVMSALNENPDLASNLTSNPAKAIEELTGHALEGDALQNVVSGLTGAASGSEGGFDLSGLASAAEGLLGGDVEKTIENALGGDVEKTIENALGDNIGQAAENLLGNLFK